MITIIAAATVWIAGLSACGPAENEQELNRDRQRFLSVELIRCLDALAEARDAVDEMLTFVGEIGPHPSVAALTPEFVSKLENDLFELRKERAKIMLTAARLTLKFHLLAVAEWLDDYQEDESYWSEWCAELIELYDQLNALLPEHNALVDRHNDYVELVSLAYLKEALIENLEEAERIFEEESHKCKQLPEALGSADLREVRRYGALGPEFYVLYDELIDIRLKMELLSGDVDNLLHAKRSGRAHIKAVQRCNEIYAELVDRCCAWADRREAFDDKWNAYEK